MTEKFTLTNEEVLTFIAMYLIHNQQEFKEFLKPLIDKKNQSMEDEEEVFHDEIKRQFIREVKLAMAIEMGKNLHFSPEDVMIFLEDVNVEEYLK